MDAKGEQAMFGGNEGKASDDARLAHGFSLAYGQALDVSRPAGGTRIKRMPSTCTASRERPPVE